MKKDCPLKKNGGSNSNENNDGDGVNGLFMGMTFCQEIKKSDQEIKEEMGIFLGVEVDLSVNAASENRTSGTNEQWLADTGSQIHVAKENHDMKNETRKNLEPIFGCDGGKVEATKKGDLMLETTDGAMVELKNVRVVPGVKKNIISVFQLVEEGWNFEGNQTGLKLRKGSQTLNFKKSSDRNLCYLTAKAKGKAEKSSMVNNMTNGDDEDDDYDYSGMPPLIVRPDDPDSDSEDEEDDEETQSYMTRTWSDVVTRGPSAAISEPAIVSDDEDSDDEAGGNEPVVVKKKVRIAPELEYVKELKAKKVAKAKKIAEVATNEKGQKRVPIDYKVAHNQWGHYGQRRMQQMAAVFGYKLIGKPCPCDACGIAKATHSRKSKTTNVKATRPGERLFVDTTGPFPDVPQNNKYLFGVKTFEYHAEEINDGFPKLKEKVFGEDGIANSLPQTLFGGMSSDD